MNSSSYERAVEIFAELCDADERARERALAEVRREDPAVRNAVRVLLREDARDGGFLDGVVAGTLAVLEDLAADEARLPASIGSYRVLGLLGEGGMGRVFLAEQDAPRREVALKVLHFGGLGGDQRRRFALEAEALGRLEHPGIARVYEAGTAEGDVPFLAMERIEGPMLTSWAEGRGLDVRQRVELLARVADAVEHAHRRGVLHRDLKPSNVLVVPGTDAVGQPVVLDFGVAKALAADGTAPTHGTETGRVLGTLAYMSPEQIRGRTEDLDTRTDVYSLGVLLYELLAGRRPHDLAGLSLAEAARRVCDEQPARLGRLDRRLAGDLETIASKALEVPRERRYGSAAALATDLRRWLGFEPIEARPPSAVYKLGRFAVRHRAWAAGGALALAALVAGTAVSVAFGLRESHARAEADSERARADEEAAVSEAVTAFLLDLIGAASPRRSGRDVTVRAAIAQVTEARIAEQFGERPGVEVRLRTFLGACLADLGDLGAARSHLERGVELARSELEEGDTFRTTAVNELGIFLLDRRELAAAEPLLREALAVRRRVLGPTAPETLGSLCNYGNVLRHSGRPAEALPYYEEALEHADEVLGRDHAWTLTLHRSAGDALMRTGRLEEAETHARTAFELARATRGERHETTISNRSFVALVLKNQGRVDEAVAEWEETLAMATRALGSGDLTTLVLMSNLAGAYWTQGRLMEAEDLYRRNLELRTRAFGPASYRTATAQVSLGRFLQAVGLPEEACEHLAPAHARLLELLGTDHDEVLAVAALLGQARLDTDEAR